MAFNYDPEALTPMPEGLMEQAEKEGLRVVHINCDEPGAKREDQVGVGFWTAIVFLPRIGELIELEDGGKFRVVKVTHIVTTVEIGTVTGACVRAVREP